MAPAPNEYKYLGGITERPQPVSIEQAFDELQHVTFGTWIRLMVVSPFDYRKGRFHLSRLLKVDAEMLRKQFYELEEKGYISTKMNGRRLAITPLKAPMLVPPNHFINFT